MATMLTTFTTFGLIVGVLMIGVPVFGAIMMIGVKLIEGYERLKYGHK